jgi:hypothetical protein
MAIRRKIASIIIAAAATLVPAVPAFAQYAGTTPPEVLPADTETPGPAVEVEGRKQVRGVAGVAVTGADVVGLAAIGSVAVGGGFAIRRASRRRSS